MRICRRTDTAYRLVRAVACGMDNKLFCSVRVFHPPGTITRYTALPAVADDLPRCGFPQLVLKPFNPYGQEFLLLFRQVFRTPRRKAHLIHAVVFHRQSFIQFDAAQVFPLRAVEQIARRSARHAQVIHLSGDDAALQHRQRPFPVLLCHRDFLRALLAVILHGGDHHGGRVRLLQAEKLPYADCPETVGRNAFRRKAVGRLEGFDFPEKLHPHELIQRLCIRIRVLK